MTLASPHFDGQLVVYERVPIALVFRVFNVKLIIQTLNTAATIDTALSNIFV